MNNNITNFNITKELFEISWSSLLLNIKNESYKEAYEGLLISHIEYKIELRCNDILMIILSVMHTIKLHIMIIYNIEYGKFTVSYVYIV